MGELKIVFQMKIPTLAVISRTSNLALLQVDGVRFIAQTITAKQVAVVLDLDSTLLESEHLPVQPPEW